jgi:hypothetical protein
VEVGEMGCEEEFPEDGIVVTWEWRRTCRGHHRIWQRNPDLEDLSISRASLQPPTRTLVTIFVLFRFAIVLMGDGLKEDAWYLLAIGGIGMVQNFVIAATAARTLGAHGLHLKAVKAFEEQKVEQKVIGALEKLELMYLKVGASLPVFFPGALREE